MTSFEVPATVQKDRHDRVKNKVENIMGTDFGGRHHCEFCHRDAYDHTTLKAPDLVRSPKLSNVGPG